MSPRSRRLAFAALALLLAGACAALIAIGPAESPPAAATSVPEPAPAMDRLQERADRLAERAEPRVIRDGEADHEEEPPPPAVYEQTRLQAEPTARRFFAAYSLYELGRLDAAVRRSLSTTATEDFAAELLASPPRPIAATKLPPRAQLGRLTLVPGPADTGSTELGAIELVGSVRRGADASELLSIELERQGRAWRVSGLGR